MTVRAEKVPVVAPVEYEIVLHLPLFEAGILGLHLLCGQVRDQSTLNKIQREIQKALEIR